MRVLVVTTARQVGGAELYIPTLVAALRGRCEFTVAISDHPAMQPLRDALAEKAHVVPLPFDRPGALPGAAQAVRRLAGRHDVAHLISNHPASRLGILMGFTLGGARTPYVVIEQRATQVDDVRVPGYLTGALPGLFRRSRARAARVIAVSEENRRTLIGYYGLRPEQIAFIHNGIDVARYAAPHHDGLRRKLGLDPDAQLVLTAASLLENKGHRYLVEAAAAVGPHFPQAHFVIAGEGEKRAAIEAQVAAAGLAGRFAFIGFWPDFAGLVTGSDLFVLPSLAEGFSLALVEAMAGGLLTIATRVGGAPEVIEDAVNGYLVPPADAPALAGALTRALDLSAKARAAMSAAARRTAQTFSVEAMAERTLALYEEVTRPDRMQQEGGRAGGRRSGGGGHAGPPVR
jgi:glycosyltransferase involved in cell wall biosynthesis